MSNTTPAPVMSDAFYDKMKFVALVLLPALGAAYFSLSQVWGGRLPYPEEVVGTITVLDTLLGLLLRQSNNKYKEATEGELIGIINFTETDTKVTYDLEFPSADPNDIMFKDKVTFKVNRVRS